MIKRRTGIIVVIAVILFSLIGWLSVTMYAHWQLAQQIPADIRQQADFPLYVSSNGTISSVTYTSNVLQYTATVDSAQLSVTEQTKTSDFALSNFTKSDNITDANTITTPNGSALLGTVGPLHVAILQTSKTIVTVTGPQTASQDTLERIIRAMQQI